MKLCHRTIIIKARAHWKVPPGQPLQSYRKEPGKANHLVSVYSGAKCIVFRHMHYFLYYSNLIIYVTVSTFYRKKAVLSNELAQGHKGSVKIDKGKPH